MSRKNGHTIPYSESARENHDRIFRGMPKCCGTGKPCQGSCGWKYQCKAKQEYKEAKDA